MIDSPPLWITSYSKIIRTDGKKYKSNSHHIRKKKKISEKDVKFSAQILYRDRSPYDIPIPIGTTGAEGRWILRGTSVPCISEASLSPGRKRIQLEKQQRKALGNAESKANVFTPPTMHPRRGCPFLRAMEKQPGIGAINWACFKWITTSSQGSWSPGVMCPLLTIS